MCHAASTCNDCGYTPGPLTSPSLHCRAIIGGGGGGGGTTELAMCARLVKCVCCANKYECGLIELKWRVARAARGASASAFAFAPTSALALPLYCLHFYTHVRPSVKPRSKQDWLYLSLLLLLLLPA